MAHGLGAADGGATARTCGDVRPSAACGLPAARAPATSAEASRLLPELRAVLPPAPFQLRGSQARLCVPLGEGRDYLGVAATGSGKSVILFVGGARDQRVARPLVEAPERDVRLRGAVDVVPELRESSAGI